MDHWNEQRRQLEEELGEPITLDALAGPLGYAGVPCQDDSGAAAGWLIAQRKNGHRHSIDDVLTAWYALQVSPRVTHHLDLGTGIGTVGLLALWGMGAEARLTCIEAQDISYRLLRTNLLANGLLSRVHSIHGDLRQLTTHLPAGSQFPLITGSPPYFPAGTGVLPADSQKAHARFELRGDVSDYARTAAAHLSPGGWFVLCFPSPQKQRALDGIAAAGLRTVRYRDVIPRATLPALFTLFACQHPGPDASPVEEVPLTVRHSEGRLTEEMAAVRHCFGFPHGPAHGGYV
jgi:tRNA1(Val) A37 N6-methylase TrmN6